MGQINKISSQLNLLVRQGALALFLFVSPGLGWQNKPPHQEIPEAVRLPDLQTLPPHDFRLSVDQTNGRKILRFSNSIVNIGEGVFELNGAYVRENDTIAVTQYLYYTQNNYLPHAVGEFDFDRQHYHWHWPGFALYELFAVRPGGQPEKKALTVNKVGYCMYDARPIDDRWLAEHHINELAVAPERVYDQCGWRLQGLSVGWVDVYDWDTPGQILDITGLEDGLYLLRSTVDPDGLMLEANPDNNTAGVYILLRGDRVIVLGEYLHTAQQTGRSSG